VKKKSSKKSAPARQRVPLKYFFPHASTLCLAGSFNEWNEAGISLHPVGEGYWAIDLELAPGRHEFRLIVDGTWIDVPDAVEQVENPFGSRNAVLLVAPAT
jgi:hypothetical protein